MATIDDLARAIARELSPQFEQRLRAELADRDREWLVDELVRLTLARHGFEDLDRDAAATSVLRAQRLQRVREMAIDHAAVERFVAEATGETREHLVAEGYLVESAPAKGTALIREDHRTARRGTTDPRQGRALRAALRRRHHGARLQRVGQGCSLAVPRSKAGALDFMRASTELPPQARGGTRQRQQRNAPTTCCSRSTRRDR
jgi:hypothetical protein